MIVIVLALVAAALLFAAEEGSVHAQQLVARRLRQRRNVITIADADGSLDNDSKRTSLRSTRTATVTTPHHTSSRENTKNSINSNNAHFFNQDDLEYWRGMIRKTEEIMSMPHGTTTKAESSKHKSSKAAKMTKTEKKEKEMYHNPNTRNEEYHAMKKKKKEEDKKKKEEGKW
jgi:hypothetical protein